MKLYQLSEEANTDFLEAYDYLDARSQSATARWEQTMLRAFDHLAQWPHAGHRRPDLTPSPVLFWPVAGYLIAYHPQSTPLTIVAVLHGSRDAASILNARLI